MTTVDACQAEEDALKGGSKGAKAAKWASAVLQRRAWSKAWLALLRLPLPQDILKKVGALSNAPSTCGRCVNDEPPIFLLASDISLYTMQLRTRTSHRTRPQQSKPANIY